jgi:hypothetical protein
MPAALSGLLARLTQPQEIEAVRLHQEPRAPQPLPGERVQQAAVCRFDRPAALADGVVVVAVRQPEVGGAADVDLLDEAGVPHPFEDAIGRDQPEPGRSPPRAPPEILTGGKMTPGGERFENGDSLRRDAEAGAAEEYVQTIAGQPAPPFGSWLLPVSNCL